MLVGMRRPTVLIGSNPKLPVDSPCCPLFLSCSVKARAIVSPTGISRAASNAFLAAPESVKISFHILPEPFSEPKPVISGSTNPGLFTYEKLSGSHTDPAPAPVSISSLVLGIASPYNDSLILSFALSIT